MGSGAWSGHSVAHWLNDHLQDMTGGRVRNIVPSIYEAYVRILHPVHDASGTRVRWSYLAQDAGIGMRANLQWEELVERFLREPESSMPVVAPPEPGCLDKDSMNALIRLVDPLGQDGSCVSGIWDGWAWLNDIMAPGATIGSVTFPHRAYLLFEGRLREVAVVEAGLIGARSPNLLWPVDRSWFLASEVDLDSSILCGARELCEAVLASSEIEALSIGPDDVLAVEG
jgi:hypothetical protein